MTRARYLETQATYNLPGTIRVECCRWEVDGLHHKHEFRFIAEATTSTNFIIHTNKIEHRVNGELVGSFEWGHSSVDAYKWSQEWYEQGQGYTTRLISSQVFRHDLPCCGGVFVRDKEIIGYCSILLGHCNQCKQKWQITDGNHFNKAS